MTKQFWSKVLAVAMVFSMVSSSGGVTKWVLAGDKLDICHTDNGAPPYQLLNLDPNGIKNGHDGHSGDIIPPFDTYPGKNWNTNGQAIWNNGCIVPTTTTTTTTSTSTTTTSTSTTTTKPIGHCDNSSDCNNGLYCDGVETCGPDHKCKAGTPADCSRNDLPSIGNCNNDPVKLLTWDSKDAFTSACNEITGGYDCTTGSDAITHTCDKKCGAGCVSSTDCNDDNPNTTDTCNLTSCQCEHATIPSTCGNGTIEEGTEDCDGQAGITQGENFCSTSCNLIPIYNGGNTCSKGTTPTKVGDTYTIYGNDIDGINIPVEAGKEYLFRASGLFKPNDTLQADAGYTLGEGNSQYGIKGTGNDYAAHALLGDLGQGVGVINWGDYNSDHIYNFSYIIPASFTNSQFVIGDRYGDWFKTDWQDQKGMSDNKDSLKLDVYECVPVPTCEANVNLLKNGSFETPLVTDPANWQLFSTGTSLLDWVVGWVTQDHQGPPQIEIQKGVVINPSEGGQNAELDSTAPTYISQSINTLSGYDYKLTFDFAARPNTPEGDNKVEIWIGGVLKDTIERNDASWQSYSYTFGATDNATEIKFVDVGVPNTDMMGTLLDNVQVECVGETPNPTPTGSLTICKYKDLEPFGQTKGDEDTPLAWDMTVTYPNQSTSVVHTNRETGCVTINDLLYGTYTVAEGILDGWTQTYPVDPSTRTAIINADSKNPSVYFLNKQNSTTPTTSAGTTGGGGQYSYTGGQVAGATTENTGEVLGASTESCDPYLLKYIKLGANNDPAEVRKLQYFLNEYLNINLPVDGVYSLDDYMAVEQFQLMTKGDVLQPWVDIGLQSSADDPTGYVYRTTQRKINLIVCPDLGLAMPDLSDEIGKKMHAFATATATEDGSVLGASTETLTTEATTTTVTIPVTTISSLNPGTTEGGKNFNWFFLFVGIAVVVGGLYLILSKKRN